MTQASWTNDQSGLPPAGSFGSSGCSGLVGYWSRCLSSTFWWVVWPLPSRPSSLAPSCSPLWSSSGPLCLGIGDGEVQLEKCGNEMQQVWWNNMGFIWNNMVSCSMWNFWGQTGSDNFLGDFLEPIFGWLLRYRKYQFSNSKIFPRFRSLRHQASVSCCLDGPWNWFLMAFVDYAALYTQLCVGLFTIELTI